MDLKDSLNQEDNKVDPILSGISDTPITSSNSTAPVNGSKPGPNANSTPAAKIEDKTLPPLTNIEEKKTEISSASKNTNTKSDLPPLPSEVSNGMGLPHIEGNNLPTPVRPAKQSPVTIVRSQGKITMSDGPQKDSNGALKLIGIIFAFLVLSILIGGAVILAASYGYIKNNQLSFLASYVPVESIPYTEVLRGTDSQIVFYALLNTINSNTPSHKNSITVLSKTTSEREELNAESKISIESISNNTSSKFDAKVNLKNAAIDAEISGSLIASPSAYYYRYDIEKIYDLLQVFPETEVNVVKKYNNKFLKKSSTETAQTVSNNPSLSSLANDKEFQKIITRYIEKLDKEKLISFKERTQDGTNKLAVFQVAKGITLEKLFQDLPSQIIEFLSTEDGKKHIKDYCESISTTGLESKTETCINSLQSYTDDKEKFIKTSSEILKLIEINKGEIYINLNTGVIEKYDFEFELLPSNTTQTQINPNTLLANVTSNVLGTEDTFLQQTDILADAKTQLNISGTIENIPSVIEINVPDDVTNFDDFQNELFTQAGQMGRDTARKALIKEIKSKLVEYHTSKKDYPKSLSISTTSNVIISEDPNLSVEVDSTLQVLAWSQATVPGSCPALLKATNKKWVIAYHKDSKTKDKYILFTCLESGEVYEGVE